MCNGATHLPCLSLSISFLISIRFLLILLTPRNKKYEFGSGSTGFGFRWVLSTGYLGSSLMAARLNLLLFFSNFSPSFIKAFILGFYQGSGHELVGYFVPDDSMSLLI